MPTTLGNNYKISYNLSYYQYKNKEKIEFVEKDEILFSVRYDLKMYLFINKNAQN